MIEVLCEDRSLDESGPMNTRSSLIARLNAAYVYMMRVDDPTGTSVVLCFARASSELLTSMAPALRSRLVLVDEGRSLAPEVASSMWETLGLLGFVESSAWSKWQQGMFVTWGLFGREDVAARAGLAASANVGLQPADHREELSKTLARYPAAAESIQAVPSPN